MADWGSYRRLARVSTRPRRGRRRVTRLLLTSCLLAAVAVSVGAPAAHAVPAFTPLQQFGQTGHAELYGWGMETLPDGSVLVGDYWNFRIRHYAADGTFIDDIVPPAPLGSGPGGHLSPYGIAVNPATNMLYFGDVDGGYNVEQWNLLDKSFVREWGSNGIGVGRFQYPSYLTVDHTGRVIVSDQWGHNVVVHDASGGELFQFGTNGGGSGQFRQPRGIDVDADDRIFVVDNYNLRVQVFSPAGVFQYAFGSSGDDPGEFAPGADLRGLAVDEANGWVYVVDVASGYVNKFELDGTFLMRFGGYGQVDGKFVGGGRDVAVDPSGNVWVGDMPGFRAQKFDSDGNFLLAVPTTPAPPPLGGFCEPRSVGVDADGNVFVTDTHNFRIQKFAADGTPLLEWGKRGGGDLKFNYARGLAVDRRDGSVIVADTDNHFIKKYTNTGQFVWAVGGFGTAAGKFKNPHSVDIGPDGRIYVADTQNYRVQVLSETGAHQLTFGSMGTGNGQFRFPRGIDIADDGTIWVSDSVRNTVQQFTATGGYERRIGASGTADNQLRQASDVETYGDHVFVADTDSDKIKVWTRTGTFVVALGGTGTTPGRFRKPHGMDVTPDGFLYVTEQGGERVQKLRIDDLPPDTAPPDGVLLVPATVNQTLTGSPTTVSGTATDDRGVSAVDVSIRQVATGQYLSATGTWTSSFAWIRSTLSEVGEPEVDWSFTFDAPADGTYNVQVRAIDTSGMVDPTRPSRQFKIVENPDVNPPDGVLLVPATANQTITGSPTTVSGNATDDRGVAVVDVAIRRVSTGQYLTASGTWVSTLTWLPSALTQPGATQTDWSFTFDAPADGTYSANVRAKDTSGLVDPTKPLRQFNVVENPDVTPPDGVLLVPLTAGQTLTGTPTTVSGNATDDRGVGGVDVAIRRVATGEYLTAAGTWGATFVYVPSVLSQPGATQTDWSFSFTAPADGTYSVQVKAVDTSGLVDPTKPFRPFNVVA